ncbi:MAG: 5'/3'-nucleotidase SurE [Spirochaetes bacterium]|nr:5'/3'-nucleotidase SurE [Spirochaetota bacterium]
MNILLTNDDGYQAEGLNFLLNYFSNKKHKVFTVAPDIEKSGCSHSLTFSDTIRLVEHKQNLWALKGTPVDCVILGLLGLVPEKIDIVISGINHGPNIGRDILYSGTAAAARQAGLSGMPAIALSINAWRPKFIFDTIAVFLDKYFNKLLNADFKNYFFNINFPNISFDKIKGVKKTIPCINHYYQDELIHFDSPYQGRYYWVKGSNPVYKLEEGTDAYAVKNDFISVSAVKIFPEAVDFDIEF